PIGPATDGRKLIKVTQEAVGNDYWTQSDDPLFKRSAPSTRLNVRPMCEGPADRLSRSRNDLAVDEFSHRVAGLAGRWRLRCQREPPALSRGAATASATPIHLSQRQ